MLFLEALEYAVPKGYIYFAVAFSLLIELTNIRVVKKRKSDPVKLHKPFNEADISDVMGQGQAEEQYSSDPSYPIGKFVPKENYTAQEISELISRIEKLPAKIEEATRNLSDEQLDTAYRDGGWTLRQVIHHLADSHMNAYIRVKWTITENTPTIKAYDQKSWAETPDAKLPVAISINLLKSLHTKWVDILKALKPDQLSKEFIHPETQKHVRIDRMIDNYAWHGEHHLAHIKVLKRNRGW
jgi:hypothetical protein